ncbi:hypothetical protein FOA43_000148 [Brettanomyces nanus]|uniref:Uncharacterized protein n=1 Tax=Eeniella nana TaxID=13502 RepID=A0A875RVZ8_EENNA|nr:uncharacterized protein FOA43_000148 [Brettanomyces nanus]QPG72846.1 hypothetical protein FOA43_000148 [Brettanomyces nanus]
MTESKRVPLADKTKLFTNSLRRSNVSKITKIFFKKGHGHDRNSRSRGSANIASFIKSFSAPSSKQKGMDGSEITKSLVYTDSTAKKSYSTSDVVPQRSSVRVFHTDGPLSGQLTKEQGRINTMNTILAYDQPIFTTGDVAEIQKAVIVRLVNDMSKSFKLVQLLDKSLVGLLNFQKIWIKIKPGDKLKLSNDFFTIKLDGEDICCYYRWYKVVFSQK